MLKATNIQIAGTQLQLHPLKAIFWEERQCLLLADLHLGKAQHFRKAGIPVPVTAGDVNWDKLIHLLLDYQPKRVLILGDLFHSSYNPVWEEFGGLVGQFKTVQFELVVGNHDILAEHQYERFGIRCYREPVVEGPFIFSHHPLEEVPDGFYNLAGHLHPGVRLRGAGRQALRLPCFWLGKRQGILPAFGAFTGLATIRPEAGDQVFVVAEERVVRV